ncbi:MAG: hypothetical protein CM15mP74_08340 [Halieaceae bacterium]|nr:MAG: hypothetical protein CM15mP74_08340 [Halieaceae bacterium]
MVDNIQLACGHPAQNGCGIRPRVERSTAFWCLYSPQMVRLRRSGTAALAPMTRPWAGTTAKNDSLNLITWDVSDSGDPDIGMAMNVQFGNNGADGVFFSRPPRALI